MGVAIVSGCGLRVEKTSPIDFFVQKTLVLIPYSLILSKYGFTLVTGKIFQKSLKGRGHRLGGHITF